MSTPLTSKPSIEISGTALNVVLAAESPFSLVSNDGPMTPPIIHQFTPEELSRKWKYPHQSAAILRGLTSHREELLSSQREGYRLQSRTLYAEKSATLEEMAGLLGIIKNITRQNYEQLRDNKKISGDEFQLLNSEAVRSDERLLAEISHHRQVLAALTSASSPLGVESNLLVEKLQYLISLKQSALGLHTSDEEVKPLDPQKARILSSRRAIHLYDTLLDSPQNVTALMLEIMGDIMNVASETQMIHFLKLLKNKDVDLISISENINSITSENGDVQSVGEMILLQLRPIIQLISNIPYDHTDYSATSMEAILKNETICLGKANILARILHNIPGLEVHSAFNFNTKLETEASIGHVTVGLTIPTLPAVYIDIDPTNKPLPENELQKKIGCEVNIYERARQEPVSPTLLIRLINDSPSDIYIKRGRNYYKYASQTKSTERRRSVELTDYRPNSYINYASSYSHYLDTLAYLNYPLPQHGEIDVETIYLWSVMQAPNTQTLASLTNFYLKAEQRNENLPQTRLNRALYISRKFLESAPFNLSAYTSYIHFLEKFYPPDGSLGSDDEQLTIYSEIHRVVKQAELLNVRTTEGQNALHKIQDSLMNGKYVRQREALRGYRSTNYAAELFSTKITDPTISPRTAHALNHFE